MARKILDDETTLDQSAEIYNKHDEETERQNIKELGKKEKIKHFKDYYLRNVLFVLFILGILIFAIRDIIMSQRDSVLYIAVVDEYFDAETTDRLLEELTEFYDMNPDKQSITINTNFQSNSLDSLSTLTTLMYAGDVDIIIAPKAVFTEMAESGYFLPCLSEQATSFYEDMPEELQCYAIYEAGENSDPYATPDVEDPNSPDNENAQLFGISLTDCKKYEKLNASTEEPVISIAASSKNPENAAKFIQDYLFDE